MIKFVTLQVEVIALVQIEEIKKGIPAVKLDCGVEIMKEKSEASSCSFFPLPCYSLPKRLL